MKFKFLSLLLLSASLLIVSCGGDPDCTADSVVGTYTGSNDCDPDDITDATMTVTASGDNITFNDGEGTIFTTTLNDCTTETITETIDIFGISVTTSQDVTFTETTMALRVQASGFGISEDCTITLTKQ